LDENFSRPITFRTATLTDAIRRRRH